MDQTEEVQQENLNKSNGREEKGNNVKQLIEILDKMSNIRKKLQDRMAKLISEKEEIREFHKQKVAEAKRLQVELDVVYSFSATLQEENERLQKKIQMLESKLLKYEITTAAAASNFEEHNASTVCTDNPLSLENEEHQDSECQNQLPILNPAPSSSFSSDSQSNCTITNYNANVSEIVSPICKILKTWSINTNQLTTSIVENGERNSDPHSESIPVPSLQPSSSSNERSRNVERELTTSSKPNSWMFFNRKTGFTFRVNKEQDQLFTTKTIKKRQCVRQRVHTAPARNITTMRVDSKGRTRNAKRFLDSI